MYKPYFLRFNHKKQKRTNLTWRLLLRNSNMFMKPAALVTTLNSFNHSALNQAKDHYWIITCIVNLLAIQACDPAANRVYELKVSKEEQYCNFLYQAGNMFICGDKKSAHAGLSYILPECEFFLEHFRKGEYRERGRAKYGRVGKTHRPHWLSEPGPTPSWRARRVISVIWQGCCCVGKGEGGDLNTH